MAKKKICAKKGSVRREALLISPATDGSMRKACARRMEEMIRAQDQKAKRRGQKLLGQ